MAAEGSPHWTLCAPPRRQVRLLRTSRPISSCSLIRSGRVTTEIGSGARGAALHIFQKRRVRVSTATWSSGFLHLRQSQPFCKAPVRVSFRGRLQDRSEEHTSELQSHSFISYAVFCLQ